MPIGCGEVGGSRQGAELEFRPWGGRLRGSGVVHAMGGLIGLAGAICIGARIGKYGRRVNQSGSRSRCHDGRWELSSWRLVGSGLILARRFQVPTCGSV